jgi:diguanylate cyclase (GGDEF)-like protein
MNNLASDGGVRSSRGKPQSVLASVSQQLGHIEKRDGELWLALVITSVLVVAVFLALLYPAAFLNQNNISFEISIPRPLFLALVAILALLNTYVVSRRLDSRRTRAHLISSTIQSELVRLQSFTDPLTEVYNRRSLDDMAGRFISHARRLRRPLTFMLIDVDRFKQVNTRFGHLTGDFVLAEIAALLKNSVRGSDAVIRYGGDEFVIILADASREGTGQVIARIRNYLRDWNREGHLEDFKIALSIGIGEWQDGMTLDEVLDRADQDMYACKSQQSSGNVLTSTPEAAATPNSTD